MTLMAAWLLLAVPCVKADTAVSAADQKFMLAAAQGGMTEVKLGELAAQNGDRADVKDFGQMMVRDHSAINADLKTLAAQKEVTLPDALDAKHQRLVNKLAALSGPAFDDAYIAAMMKGHKMDAKAFKSESEATTDPDVKGFVDKSLRVVQMHLDKIMTLRQ